MAGNPYLEHLRNVEFARLQAPRGRGAERAVGPVIEISRWNADSTWLANRRRTERGRRTNGPGREVQQIIDRGLAGA